MLWNNFYLFAIVAMLLSAGGAAFAWHPRSKRCWPTVLTLGAIAVLASFVGALWVSLQRPPLRTMGETRLWYSLFSIIVGLITYRHWHFKWILSFTTVLSAVFCIINIVHPELHDRSMMPALQSAWFVPHVAVYMFAYAIMGCAVITAIASLIKKQAALLRTTDNLIYIGVALITLGILSGAVWAKQAWGDYWSWDPKETWAAITWTIYMIYIHIRQSHATWHKTACILVIIGFLGLQMCWYGFSYLSTSQQSVHSYSQIQ